MLITGGFGIVPIREKNGGIAPLKRSEEKARSGEIRHGNALIVEDVSPFGQLSERLLLFFFGQTAL